MRPQPVGHYVLVEIPEKEEKSAGGIYLPDELTNKEQRATEQGKVIAIGPNAYHGWAGCETDGFPDKEPHQLWGIEVGDWVEFRKYEGKESVFEGYERYRYLPDSHIVGKGVEE